MGIYTAEIKSNKEIALNIFKMEVEAADIAGIVKPGQFIQLYPPSEKNMLARPFSVSSVSNEGVTIVYRIVGIGTKLLSNLRQNDFVQIMGPLGNGFTLSDNDAGNLVIGGGLGIPPLLELSKRLQGKTEVLLGYSDEPFMVEDFQKLNLPVRISTITGKVGFHGNVLELLKSMNPSVGQIFACGPRPMLKSVSEWAKKHGIPIQVSMEERMACGIGACLGCGIKIQRQGENDWKYMRVCKDGPVFLGEEVVWDG